MKLLSNRLHCQGRSCANKGVGILLSGNQNIARCDVYVMQREKEYNKIGIAKRVMLNGNATREINGLTITDNQILNNMRKGLDTRPVCHMCAQKMGSSGWKLSHILSKNDPNW